MKKTLKLPLLAGMTAFCLGLGTSHAAKPKGAAKNSKSAKIIAAKQNFTPSNHPGVMVRSVPQVNPHSRADETSIYRKPGAARPTRALRSGSRTVMPVREGRSAKGGRAASLPDSRMPLITARKTKDGKLVIK